MGMKPIPTGYSIVSFPDLFDINRLGDQKAITENQVFERVDEFLGKLSRLDIEIVSVFEVEVVDEKDRSGVVWATRVVRYAILRRRGEEEV